MIEDIFKGNCKVFKGDALTVQKNESEELMVEIKYSESEVVMGILLDRKQAIELATALTNAYAWKE